MKNKVLPSTLYLIPTPIGNLTDMSERSLKILNDVDFIAAEDTRNTQKLLSIFNIQKPLVSYFEHNKRQRGEYITNRIANGESCALVTDAGTPAISDPGEDIVKLCAERQITVTSIPGPCAAITALTLSGLPTGRFAFEGFLSVTKSERHAHLSEIKSDPHTLIFYEAPHKLKHTLSDLLTSLGDRQIALCRELTKLNEQVIRCSISQAISYYAQNDPRGEYVLVVSGAEPPPPPDILELNPQAILSQIADMANSGINRMDAIKAIAHKYGIPKNDIYKIAIQKKPE